MKSETVQTTDVETQTDWGYWLHPGTVGVLMILGWETYWVLNDGLTAVWLVGLLMPAQVWVIRKVHQWVHYASGAQWTEERWTDPDHGAVRQLWLPGSAIGPHGQCWGWARLALRSSAAGVQAWVAVGDDPAEWFRMRIAQARSGGTKVRYDGDGAFVNERWRRGSEARTWCAQDTQRLALTLHDSHRVRIAIEALEHGTRHTVVFETPHTGTKRRLVRFMEALPPVDATAPSRDTTVGQRKMRRA